MSMTPRPPIPSFIPESAPFTPEQRTWLNGLFAGLFGLEDSVTPISAAEAAKLLPGLVAGGIAAAEIKTDNAAAADDGAPWHDPAMPMPDRMKLAESRPLPRRFMAAMAQQDCGQCGYNCNDYADALFGKSEKRLNLCVPGGKETSRMLKQLYQELESAPPQTAPTPAPAPVPAETAPVSPTRAAPAPIAGPGRSRDKPVQATFLARRRLNKAGSLKETWHIDIDLAGSNLDYVVGDSFGIFPANDSELVDAVLAAIDAPPDFPIGDRTLREELTDGVSLSPAPDMLFELISHMTGGERKQKAKKLASGQDPDGDAATLDVLAALHKFPRIRPDPEAFIESLDPLQPRLYSISSSLKTTPARVSLTVDAVRYEIGMRVRHGVCSTFLGGRVAPGDKVKVYVQRAQHFALPADPSKPVIMIGPGTGVAPFRAFLHERQATGAPGHNWLFYGHQRSQHDFFYEDELTTMHAAGFLTKLSLAWSRDGKEKVYVQQRMREAGRELWSWLNDGAHVYVCGDALRMAKDVEAALLDIITEHGGRAPADAAKFLAELKASDRYQADVY
jgi:sulfite reductase (NADPH) flavoprotein alpha-component